MKIPNKLKFYREKMNLTQAKLAKMVGLGERHYQKIEYGSTKPNVETALLLAQALQTTVEDLFLIPQRQLREKSLQNNTKK